MAEDPWAAFRKAPPTVEAVRPAEDPWAAFRPKEAGGPARAPEAAPAVDPIRAQVRKELDAERAAGLPQDGATREWLQGATFNTADEILAGLMTLPNMVKRGVGPSEAYAFAKAKENMRLEDARQSSGALGTAAEILGGMGVGGQLLKAGVTAIPAATARLGKIAGTAAGSAVDGAVLGAVSGFADGEGAERLARAGQDATVGGLAGGAIPLAGAALAPVVAPVTSNIMARVNPEKYAGRQVGRAAARSGQDADQIAARIEQAAADGQGEYRLLDALDYPGARLGAVVAKNPGEGRTTLRKFLNERQEGQSYRLSEALSEGLDAPETAQAATNRMTAARREMDDTAFNAVRGDAEAVDVTPTVKKIDETLRPGLTGELNLQNGIAYDSVEGALARARALLTDGKSQVTDFAVVQRARGDIADAVQKAVRSGEHNKARLLRQVRFELDKGLQTASPSFKEAMEKSRAAAREIEAVETGRAAASRGRSEDKIAAFAELTPAEQAAFRTGYADPLIERVQGAAEGANKARPFTSQAMQTELPAIAGEQRGPKLMRQIDREGEMFANRGEALGNSKTAENLADNADTGIDAGLFRKILSGDWIGATKDALSRGAAGINGNTEAVRTAMAKLLMNGSPEEVRAFLTQIAQAQGQNSELGAALHRGLLAGGLPTLNASLAESNRQPSGQPARKGP